MGNLRETWGEMVLCTPLHVHCFWFRHFFPRIELYKRRLIDRQLASFRLSEFISKLKLRTFTLMIFRRWLCPILFIIRIMRLKFWKFENNLSTTYATLKFYMSCNLLNCCPFAEIKNLRTTNNNSEESAKKTWLDSWRLPFFKSSWQAHWKSLFYTFVRENSVFKEGFTIFNQEGAWN